MKNNIKIKIFAVIVLIAIFFATFTALNLTSFAFAVDASSETATIQEEV